jgi:hypothetical protein
VCQPILPTLKLHRAFEFAYKNRDHTFGNARLARNMFEEITKNQANRIVHLETTVPPETLDRYTLMTITENDVPDLQGTITEPLTRIPQ